jgi:hypothetical protein
VIPHKSMISTSALPLFYRCAFRPLLPTLVLTRTHQYWINSPNKVFVGVAITTAKVDSHYPAAIADYYWMSSGFAGSDYTCASSETMCFRR